MYKNFYQMTQEPFQNYPLPDLFFKSLAHQAGWRYLLLGIKAKEPYLLVTGEYGAGKTLLCLRLLKGMTQKPEYFPHAFISTPNSSYFDILKKIGGAIGVPSEVDRESALQRDILEVFERQERPGPFYLIFDDAQDIDPETLHNLRLFANFSCNGIFPFRLILFAHNSFLQRLKAPVLCSLDQRIKRRFYLASLQPEETGEYIYFRLLNSGARGRPFFDEHAIRRIHSCSGGVPRVINNLCDACLLIGAGEELGVIDARTVERAEAYLGMIEESGGSNASATRSPDDQKKVLPLSEGGEEVAAPKFDVEGRQLRFGEDIDFLEVPDRHLSAQPEQVVPGWDSDGASGSRFGLGGFFSGRKGRFFLVLLLILVFVVGFFWQRYSVGVSLGLTSSSSALPVPVDGEIALWLEPKLTEEPTAENRRASQKMLDQSSAGGETTLSGSSLERSEPPEGHANEADSAPSAEIVSNSATQPPPPAPVPKVLHLLGKEYTLVISSCRKRDSAFAVIERLAPVSSTLDIGLGQLAYNGGTPWWVVHRGTFASREEAAAARQSLHLQDALVRKLPYLVVDSRLGTSDAAEERYQWLKAHGEHPFLVGDGDWVDVCLGRYDTVERAAFQVAGGKPEANL